MRRCLCSLVGLTLVATALDAQGLRDKISDLFIFGAGQDPLFLSGTAGSDAATALHADHFVPSAVSDNGTLISFIGTAISQNVANIPVSATSGGAPVPLPARAPAPGPPHTLPPLQRYRKPDPLFLSPAGQSPRRPKPPGGAGGAAAPLPPPGAARGPGPRPPAATPGRGEPGALSGAPPSKGRVAPPLVA